MYASMWFFFCTLFSFVLIYNFTIRPFMIASILSFVGHDFFPIFSPSLVVVFVVGRFYAGRLFVRVFDDISRVRWFAFVAS